MFALGVAVGFVHGNWARRDHLLRLIVLSGLSVFAVWIAHRREKAEVTFRESEQRYRILFERNLYGVIRASFGGTVLDCNEGAARLLGYDSRSELIGKSIKVRASPGSARGPGAFLRPADKVLTKQSEEL